MNLAMLKIIISTIFILSFAKHAFAATQTELPIHLQNFIEKFQSQQKHLQGGAIAVLYKGQVIYKSTFGNQKDNAGPITPNTMFPLASVSKPVSVAALALMIEEGTLHLDEKIKLSPEQKAVSLKNILSHTTGYSFSGNSQIEQGISRQKLLDHLKQQKPKCNPGACYSYSNTTFSLVEEVLNTHDKNLRTAITKLGMALKTNEIQVVPIKSDMEIAYPHRKSNTGDYLQSLPFPPFYPKATPAAAGVFASLNGMIEVFKLSFGYRPDLISQKTLDYLHSPIISNRDIDGWVDWGIKWPYKVNEIESYYGLGWRILKAKDCPDKELIFHEGHIAGIVSFIGFIPSEQIGIIILINEKTPVAFQSSIDLWGEFLKSYG